MKTLERSIRTRIKRRQDGTQEVVFPDGLLPWRLGQRVWFRATSGRIELTLKPCGPRGTARHSRRVRRGVRSLLKSGTP